MGKPALPESGQAEASPCLSDGTGSSGVPDRDYRPDPLLRAIRTRGNSQERAPKTSETSKLHLWHSAVKE